MRLFVAINLSDDMKDALNQLQNDLYDRGVRGNYTPEENKALEINTSAVSCCGCSACYSICPVGAITMIADEEGFLYPMVNNDKCILCRSCERVCSFRSDRMLKE